MKGVPATPSGSREPSPVARSRPQAASIPNATFRLTEGDDPEERLEEAALWKALHDEYGDEIVAVTGNVQATFGRGLRSSPLPILRYWEDPAFLDNCVRRFSVVSFDLLELAVGELHEDGLGAFVKSTRDKHAIFRIPVGVDPNDVIGDFAYSFIEGGPPLMVQQFCEIAHEHRFFCVDREIITFSQNRPDLTPLDFPEKQSPLSRDLLPLCDVAQRVVRTMQQPHAVIDVAYINGVAGVVELNLMRLGQVGLFACDVRALAEASRKLLPAIAMEARQGGDACGSVHDSAGRQASPIAKSLINNPGTHNGQ